MAGAALILTALLGGASPAAGQVPVEQTADTLGVSQPADSWNRNVISANPFLFLAEWFNAEYERAVRRDVTLGVGASLFTFDDDDDEYRSLGFFLRYYPQERAPAGFYGGARLSYVGVSEGYNDCYDCGDNDYSASAFGLEIGYNWLLGSDENFYLSFGVGLSRLFGGDSSGEEFLPIIRIVNVGWAF
jgi:hypothetical protein